MRIDEASGPSATAGFLRRRSSMPMWMDLAWRVVLLFADSTRNYMSKFLDDKWMEERGFPLETF